MWNSNTFIQVKWAKFQAQKIVKVDQNLIKVPFKKKFDVTHTHHSFRLVLQIQFLSKVVQSRDWIFLQFLQWNISVYTQRDFLKDKWAQIENKSTHKLGEEWQILNADVSHFLEIVTFDEFDDFEDAQFLKFVVV